MFWWENQFIKVKHNALMLGKERAADIAAAHGTPLFVYSRDQLKHNYRRLRKAMQRGSAREPRICYAMKANSHPELLATLFSEGAWIDAVSPGEVGLARNAGFPVSRIMFTGTSLGMEDMQKVMCHNDLIITIDAEPQLDIMYEAREQWFPEKTIRVAIRLNPGMGRGFSPKAVTAGTAASDGTPIKFGVEKDQVLAVFHRAADMGFKPAGLHQHLGSGWERRDLDTVKSAVETLASVAAEVQAHGFQLEFLDFGGGFGPRYNRDQVEFPLEDYLAHIEQKVTEHRVNVKTLVLEPGKFLMGDAGVLLIRVEYLKKNYGNLFACVNAGTFNTVPRPAIYAEARHEIVHCSHVTSDDAQEISVAGNLCETGDMFARRIELPVPKRGDILAVLYAGAYCRSMASAYNTRDNPKELLL
jgi:diaminopimelate decarboxylase